MTFRAALLPAVCIAALTLAACSSDDGSTDTQPVGTNSEVVAAPEGTVDSAESTVAAPDETTPLVEEDGTADATASASSDCPTAVGSAVVTCSDDQIIIESNGLPDHDVMVGIEEGGWNGQWPTEQDYTGSNAFVVPTEVTLVEQPLATVMNTAGVTANGIPFFFPHAPGQAGSSECLELPDEAVGSDECLRDPVLAGEMDVCGGHVGRGDDYHYHATPTCLLGEVEDGAIVGYMLDGIPMFAEPLEGSTEYDGCSSGYVSPEGLLHYAFLDSYPYLTDCMLGEFSEGPQTSGSDVFTGDLDPQSSGSIVGFELDDDGCQVMTFSSGSELRHCD